MGDKNRLSGAMPQPYVHGHILLLSRVKSYEESCSIVIFGTVTSNIVMTYNIKTLKY